MKTFENGTDCVNVCPQWKTQGYTDSRDMGPSRGIWTKILYRTGGKGTWHLVLLLKSVTWKSWKLIFYEPLLILFCSLEPVECHLLRCNLTKYIYGIILEETRTTVGRSALSFQAGPDNVVMSWGLHCQPLLVLVSKSTAWVCVTPRVLLLHPKAEKLHLSSSWGIWTVPWGGGGWSSVLSNATEHC